MSDTPYVEIIDSRRALPPPSTSTPYNDLRCILHDLILQERIDGVSVFETAEHDVMLDVAFSPVVRSRLDEDPVDQPWLLHLPKPTIIDRDARGRYFIIDPPRDVGDWHRKRPLMTTGQWEILTEDHVKLMRARYLLLRGWLYKRLHILPYDQKQATLAWYFPAGVWAPPAGSDMARAMGFKQ